MRRAAAFDRHFIGRDPLFWPLARAARAFVQLDDFPPIETLGGVFDGDLPVRFVPAAPRRRRRSPVDVQTLYDARITLERAVPTRARCWHDLMNALVWGTFPNAKRALHARQHRAISERVAPGARGLPPRSPELDSLALIDEGGLVVLTSDPDSTEAALRTRRDGVLRSYVESGAADALVFGHAIYESLALGVTPAVVAAVVLRRDGEEPDVVRAADDALARAIVDGARLRSPRELTRVNVNEAAPPSDRSPQSEARTEGTHLLRTAGRSGGNSGTCTPDDAFPAPPSFSRLPSAVPRGTKPARRVAWNEDIGSRSDP